MIRPPVEPMLAKLAEDLPGGDGFLYEPKRDGFRCLWTQRLDPATKQPVGNAVLLERFHHAALSLRDIPRGLLDFAIAPDKIVLGIGKKTGNIWLAR